ncbi:hypothetical protein LH384_34290, partial [Pseudomonas aeruginosa]|nr:hypothetical protein [Pseudomonas aeruginosa]
MTLIFIAFMVLTMVVTRWFSKYTLKYAGARQQTMSTVTGLVEEYYTGRAIIKSFNQEEESAKRMHLANEEMAQATEK